MRIALWSSLLVAALLAVMYLFFHRPFARDGTELLQVPLSQVDPELTRVGQLDYLGGIDIPRMGQNIGGLSGLRWDAQSQRLLAITDDARWVWLSLDEKESRLVGLDEVEVGNLLGPAGERLIGKEQGDSEALVRDGSGPWAVAFERDHRILVYVDGLAEPPVQTLFEPEEELGALQDNGGIEAFAVAAGGSLACAERPARPDRANCVYFGYEEDAYSDFPVDPPTALVERGAVPTDADTLSDGTFLILFRSYSPTEGNTAAIVAYSPDRTRREIVSLQPPLTTDNFEGLAVREERDDTYLYIVSDDNFSGRQRTLLMKFKLNRSHQSGPAENSP